MKALLVLAAFAAFVCSVPAPPAAGSIQAPRVRPVEKPLRGIEVLVNGLALPPNPPARVVAGHVEVPVRSILTALGVELSRNGPVLASQIGSTTIQLRIGSDQAFVNGRAVALDEPVSEARGAAYVSLRFLSDLLGAQTTYDAKAARVQIVSAVIGRSAVHDGNTVTGAVTAVDRLSQPPSITVTRGSGVRTIAINSTARIILQDVVAHTTVAGSLSDVQPGDALSATLEKDGSVKEIVDLFASRSGTIAAVTGNAFVLADGFVTTPNGAADLTINGQSAKLSDLRAGDKVTIRSNPETGEIKGIAVTRASEGTEQPAGSVTIASFSISAARALHAGESFEAVLTGTPAGRATYDIGSYLNGLPMRETSPGEYRAAFKIPDGMNFTNVPVYGNLAVQNVSAQRFEAAHQLSVATVPPQVVDVAPPSGQTVNNARPSIYATFASPTGVGINPSSIVLVVNGHDVTAAATRSDSFITYNPGITYPDGPVQVTVRVSDAAGNATTRTWSFTIRAQ